MALAIKEAWKYQILTFPNPAVGCCIVSGLGEILAVEAHKQAGKPHAEVEALQAAYYKLTNDDTITKLQASSQIHSYLLEHHNNIFQDCTLYTTLEPCSHYGKTPSCASLIKNLGIKKVVVGVNDPNEEASCGNKILQDGGIEVVSGVMQKECEDLLLPFTKALQGNFVFFKWAQRLNGTYDGGVISSQNSRELVHTMRDRCDLLVVGGETVRQDRPTLDARLVGGKAPDVLIYSHKDDFDRSIPLFGVEGREVYIESSLEKIGEYKCVMIEGGSAMFEATQEIVDTYLCFIAPTFGGLRVFEHQDTKFEILHQDKVAQDIILWMKKGS